MHLADTNDKIQLTTSAAAVTVDVVASWTDLSGTTVTPGSTTTAITTATTTDIVAAPAASTVRRIHTIFARNKHASTSVDVTVIFDNNGTDFEIHKVTLAAGECLEYIEGIGWFTLEDTSRLDQLLVVTSDVTNATTSFADVTGLSTSIKSGRTYCFEAHLLYQTNATTTGARFGINGPALTYLRLAGIGTVTVSATAGAFSTQTASVSAVDTSAIGAQTTGPGTVDSLAIISGTIVPSADGTFVIRCQSEVAVASGLIVRRGSWLHIREPDNS